MEFYTDQAFNSREELMNWVQTTGRSLGYVIVTKRSKSNASGSIYKVDLMCDLGGKFKGTGSSSRASGTKKSGCPFELEAKCSKYNIWTLRVKCDEHNHQPAQYMEGHPYARRLSETELELVADLKRKNVPPRDILSILKERDPNNVCTLKDIYNAGDKIRMAEQVGSTPMQVLLSHLHVNNYIFEFTTNGITNELESLFFVHPKSLEIWRAFPHVLIIDATYKTNIYNMPFVEIVGVTSTTKTFCIAFVFMQNEKEVSYKWALECLKLTLDECMHPRVIVTDRELSLMNACRQVFPDAARLLCRYHISTNIFRKCRQSFRTSDDWGYFLHLWYLLIDSRTWESYQHNYDQLQAYLGGLPGVFDYLENSWLSNYREMFVSVWIDEHLNFGNPTTNRVESQHAVLKKHLGSEKSSLHKFLGIIDQIVESQLTAIKQSFERSKIFRKHEHNKSCFFQLHGVVSLEALDLLLAELHRLGDLADLSDCGCKLVKSCGLPCACVISAYLNEGQCIPLDSIDIFWRKLDFSPSTSTENDDILHMPDDDISIDDELQSFKESFNKQSKSGKRSWLRKLRDIFDPSKTFVKEPVVQKHTRGRPSVKKQREKVLPDLNKAPATRYSQQGQDQDDYVDLNVKPTTLDRSRSMHSMGLDRSSTTSRVPDFNSMSARHSSYMGSQSRLPDSYLNQIPKNFHPYIACIVNVDGDGNCGFRALAVGLGLGEKGYEYVRDQMKQEFDINQKFYEMLFQDDVPTLDASLCFSGSPRPPAYWMTIPESAVLIANRLGVIVHCLSMRGSSTVFPFWIGPQQFTGDHRVVTIALVNKESHFVMVELVDDYPMPVITPYWRDKRHDCATGWEELYKERLDKYVRLCHRQPGFVEISD